MRAQMERGVSRGYPVVDIRVTLTDGRAHSVDSSDAAFASAGALALREAAAGGTVALLEPYDEVAVVVPGEHVGAVMGDLSTRRGRVLGTEEAPDGRTCVRAVVPRRELLHYPVDLRALTHGAGTFTRTRPATRSCRPSWRSRRRAGRRLRAGPPVGAGPGGGCGMTASRAARERRAAAEAGPLAAVAIAHGSGQQLVYKVSCTVCVVRERLRWSAYRPGEDNGYLAVMDRWVLHLVERHPGADAPCLAYRAEAEQRLQERRTAREGS